MNTRLRQKKVGAVIEFVKHKDILYFLPPCSFSNALMKTKVPSDSFVVLFIKKNVSSQDPSAANLQNDRFPHAIVDNSQYGKRKSLFCFKRVCRLAELLKSFFTFKQQQALFHSIITCHTCQACSVELLRRIMWHRST